MVEPKSEVRSKLLPASRERSRPAPVPTKTVASD
jgi:hypothetical protein